MDFAISLHFLTLVHIPSTPKICSYKAQHPFSPSPPSLRYHVTIPTSGKGNSSQKEVVSLRLKLQYQVSSIYMHVQYMSIFRLSL